MATHRRRGKSTRTLIRGWRTISSATSPDPLGSIISMQREDDERSAEKAHVPALPTLRAQQRDIRSRLRSGFKSRHELLVWSHVAAAISVGRVPDKWFSRLVNDQWTVAACLDSHEKRERLCGDTAPSPSEARTERTRIIQDVLSPAFQKAVDVIRAQSGDFTDEQDGVRHVDRQRFIAMRPRLHQRVVDQHRALREPFGEAGVRSQADAVEWADEVAYAASGHLPRDFTAKVCNPMSQWWTALANEQTAVLDSMLAQDVLPAWNSALRTAASNAEELASGTVASSSGGNIS
ncbi:hypothetical protein DVK05_06050 [Halorubrum sp. Atlit-8R]|nr:hypothetical protein DVK08_13070 [Halorubrum sp. Atlit-9R]RLM82104.1 hypothetical protein DVK05_06050 [Halorubrum sp. Atlit-8R]TKX61218.1 hypothetical protein EXE48_09265 [Halorubrum sp. ASP1]